MHASQLAGNFDDHYRQSCQESHEVTFRGEQSCTPETAVTLFPVDHTGAAQL